jgi:hypothetical protein
MIFRSWGMAIACLISGIFVDLDHVIDYLIQHGLQFKGNFFEEFYNDRIDKVHLLFHAWEWVFLLLITAWFTGWDKWITGIFFGFTLHIFLDNINNRANIKSYSFFWRWSKGFQVKKIFPKNFI